MNGGFVNISNVLSIHSCEIHKNMWTFTFIRQIQKIEIQIAIWLVNFNLCSISFLLIWPFLATRLPPLTEVFDVAGVLPASSESSPNSQEHQSYYSVAYPSPEWQLHQVSGGRIQPCSWACSVKYLEIHHPTCWRRVRCILDVVIAMPNQVYAIFHCASSTDSTLQSSTIFCQSKCSFMHS